MLAVAKRREIPPSSDGIPPGFGGDQDSDVKGRGDLGDEKSFEDFCNFPQHEMIQ